MDQLYFTFIANSFPLFVIADWDRLSLGRLHHQAARLHRPPLGHPYHPFPFLIHIGPHPFLHIALIRPFLAAHQPFNFRSTTNLCFVH